MRKHEDGGDFVLSTHNRLIRMLYCVEVRPRVCREVRVTSNSGPIFSLVLCTAVSDNGCTASLISRCSSMLVFVYASDELALCILFDVKVCL
jgi:hypothetical protein